MEFVLRIGGVLFVVSGIATFLSSALFRGGIISGYIKEEINPRLAYLIGTFYIIGGIIMIVSPKPGFYVAAFFLGIGGSIAAIYGKKYE